MTIRLVDLEQAPEDVEFPNGTTHAVVPFDAVAYDLQEQIERTGDTALGLQLLRRCVPTATDRDIATLTGWMSAAIIATARRQLDVLMSDPEAFRGNFEAAVRILRSRPLTPPAASAAGSPRKKAARSGKSSGSRTTRRTTRT